MILNIISHSLYFSPHAKIFKNQWYLWPKLVAPGKLSHSNILTNHIFCEVWLILSIIFDHYHNLVMISHSINWSIFSLSIINLPQICPHIDLKNLLYFVNFLLCSNFVGMDAQWPVTGASKTFSVHVRLSFQNQSTPTATE